VARILIVDDEKNIRRNLAAFLASIGYDTAEAQNGEQALAAVSGGAPGVDAVLTDFRMAEMNGLELLREIKRRSPDTPVILMTAYATVENAVATMKAGAYDYLTKPFSLDEVQHLIARALEMRGLRAENRALREAVEEIPLLESKSAAMAEVLSIARQAAASDATILLTGESGTGKNVLARQIHAWSPRQERPYVTVNCTTLSEQLLESELFGHVRGAFTGAMKDKPGRLEAADGGTVFLDEIADLSSALQTKLLRFIQEHSFERVGGNRTLRVDARIIAASNRNLEGEIAARRFREDLYYRLNVIALRVPSLRERREDIAALAEWILRGVVLRSRHAPMQLAPAAMIALGQYGWPGNVRELRNALERAVVLSKSGEITPDDLPDSVFHPLAQAHPGAAPSASLEEVEREHIVRVLAGSATLEEAAMTLGINVTTLWRKRRRYGIE
jgi:two-component system, NtrC family, response regulator AlgB